MPLPPDRLTRFSNRVSNYVAYRPDYPAEVAERLLAQLAPRSEMPALVVDLGSGTGKLSAIFLDLGASVIGVEPNREMREAAETLFDSQPRFRSVDGTAETTTLPDACADLIVMGQALHWFDIDATRRECQRLLAPGGIVGVVYNERSTRSPLLAAYEEFLHRHARAYSEVNHRNIDDATLAHFFGHDGYAFFETENHQRFDFEGLLGRYQSSSYAYTQGDDAFPTARAALADLFDRFDQDGRVTFLYDTRVYSGPLA